MRYTVSWATPTALAILGTDSEVDKRIRIRCTTSSGKRRGISEDNWLIFYFARVGGCGSALLDYFDTHSTRLGRVGTRFTEQLYCSTAPAAKSTTARYDEGCALSREHWRRIGNHKIRSRCCSLSKEIAYLIDRMLQPNLYPSRAVPMILGVLTDSTFSNSKPRGLDSKRLKISTFHPCLDRIGSTRWVCGGVFFFNLEFGEQVPPFAKYVHALLVESGVASRTGQTTR